MFVAYGGNIEKNPVTRAAIAAVKERERAARLERMKLEAQILEKRRIRPRLRPACHAAMTPYQQLLQDIDIIALMYNTNFVDLLVPSRQRSRIFARHAAMWMLWYSRSMPFSHIGALFKTDHSTVIHGIGRHMDRIGFDHHLRTSVMRRLKNRRDVRQNSKG